MSSVTTFKYKNNTYIRTPEGEYLIQGHNKPNPLTVGHLSKIHPTMRAKIHQAWLAHKEDTA